MKADEFLQKHKPELERENDITTRSAAEAWGVSDSTAVLILDDMTKGEKPELVRLDAILKNGRKGYIWRIISQE